VLMGNGDYEDVIRFYRVKDFVGEARQEGAADLPALYGPCRGVLDDTVDGLS